MVEALEPVNAYYVATALCLVLATFHTSLGPFMSRELKSKTVVHEAKGPLIRSWYGGTGLLLLVAVQNYRFAILPPAHPADELVHSAILAFTGVAAVDLASDSEFFPALVISSVGGVMAYARFWE